MRRTNVMKIQTRNQAADTRSQRWAGFSLVWWESEQCERSEMFSLVICGSFWLCQETLTVRQKGLQKRQTEGGDTEFGTSVFSCVRLCWRLKIILAKNKTTSPKTRHVTKHHSALENLFQNQDGTGNTPIELTPKRSALENTTVKHETAFSEHFLSLKKGNTMWLHWTSLPPSSVSLIKHSARCTGFSCCPWCGWRRWPVDWNSCTVPAP